MVNKSVCVNCLQFDMNKVVKNNQLSKPTWLSKENYVRNFIEKQPLKLRAPSSFNVEMKLELGNKFSGKKILYWATNEKTSKSPLIEQPKKAYGNFENSAVVKATAIGNAVLRFNCPQLYRAKETEQSKLSTFFRHLHFVVEKEGKWDSQVYTKIVICKYKFKKFIEESKSGMTVLLNALPCEYFAKDHIPNSFNLFYKTIAKMSVKDLENWFSEVIKIHYPKLATQIKNKKLEIYEIPIIVYCAHEKCNASELAIKELMKKGFVNLHEYSGGINEYRKMIPVDR